MSTSNISKAASAFGPAHCLHLNPFCPNFLAEIPVAQARRWRRLVAASLARTLVVLLVATLSAAAPAFATTRDAATPDYRLADRDHALLDAVQRRAVLYFAEHCDPQTGLARDRAPNNGASSSAPSSCAATGFALAAWCIAEDRGWLSHAEALSRVRRTLAFVARHHAHERGFLFHFVDPVTGGRVWRSEASTIDTALFLQGALLAREHFRDAETTRLVDALYARIDWRWALDGGATVSHGWRPEGGFIPHRWDRYAELMGLYLLGIGAPRHALPAASWHAWKRDVVAWHDGRPFLHCGPLFTHQYAHGWFDFRGMRDAYADYWQNSTDATLAQRAWSAQQSERFAHWSADVWGLTASDSARGYTAWGTPDATEADRSDGTLVPCAPGGSLPFAPRECLTALHGMRALGGDRLWGRYGFSDAFNPQTGWVASDVIGIDLGIMLVMAENLRTGLVWRTFMRAPEVRRGMTLAGFAPAESTPAAPALAVLPPTPADPSSDGDN